MGIVKPTREGPRVVVVLPTELARSRSVIYTLNVPEMHETSLIQQLLPRFFHKCTLNVPFSRPKWSIRLARAHQRIPVTRTRPTEFIGSVWDPGNSQTYWGTNVETAEWV